MWRFHVYFFIIFMAQEVDNQTLKTATAKKRDYAKIISWSSGIIFLFTGIDRFSSSFVSGIILILLGLYLIPPINDKIAKQTNFRPSNSLRITLVLALIFLASLTNPNIKTAQKPIEETSKTDTNSQVTQSETKIDAQNTNEKKIQEESNAKIQETKDNLVDIKNTPTELVNQPKIIKGLKPVDIYLNFENKGFKTDENLGISESSWRSTLSESGIDYDVYTYSESGVNNVSSISYSAILNFKQDKEISAVIPFLEYGATIPYEGSDQIKAKNWIKENFNKDKANIEINGVSFNINAPTKFARILKISKT